MESEVEKLKSQLAAADETISALSRAVVERGARISELSPLAPAFPTDPSGAKHAGSAQPDEGAIRALVDLANAEFQSGRHLGAAAVARLILGRALNQVDAERILSLAGPFERAENPP